MTRLIERDEVEFGRTLAFFDATFALAMTLLVTTLDPGEYRWDSFSELWDSMGTELVAFAISFALVASYWWANHRFVGSLERLSSRVIIANVAMLAFVVLIPFTTESLSIDGEDAVEVTTVVYALNMAMVSASGIGLYLLALREQLFRTPPTPDQARASVVDMSVPLVVFLLTIPIALLVSGAVARIAWLSLAVLGPLGARLTATSRRADGPDGPDEP